MPDRPRNRPHRTCRLACMAALAATPLDVPVRATWTRVPLRDWAAGVSGIAGTPVIVDRRLDPGVTVTLSSDGDPLGHVLDRVAESAGAAIEPLGPVALVVPRDAAGRASAAESARLADVDRLPAGMRRAADRRAAWTWKAASRPRDLVAAAAAGGGVAIEGLARVPHDHLPAASLPSMSLAERLDLVLVQYDLRAAWSAEGCDIVPIAPGAAPPASRPPAAARGRAVGRRPAGGPEPRYSLRLEAPLDRAVPAVAARLGLAAEIDSPSLAARGILPGEIVRVEARDVPRDELLDAVVSPLGLSWRIVDGTLRVFASPPTAGGR